MSIDTTVGRYRYIGPDGPMFQEVGKPDGTWVLAEQHDAVVGELVDRLAEWEDELEEEQRRADDAEEQLGYLKDLQASANTLWDALGIPASECLTANDVLDYAAEAIRERDEAIADRNRWFEEAKRAERERPRCENCGGPRCRVRDARVCPACATSISRYCRADDPRRKLLKPQKEMK